MPAHFRWTADKREFYYPPQAFPAIRFPQHSYDTLAGLYNSQGGEIKRNKRLSLGGTALLMCGTTGEIDDALKTADTFQIDAKDQDDRLCITYVRIKTRMLTSVKTRSLICIAPVQGWWGVKTVAEAGKDDGWRPLLEFPIVKEGLQVKDFRETVLPLGKDVKGWMQMAE
jgi:hypothetical protein